MKVLHICPSYFLTHLYENLFNTLLTKGVDNRVLSTEFKNINYPGKEESNIVALDRRFSFLQRLLFFNKQREIYKTICFKFLVHDFNLIHAHTLFTAGYAAYLLHKQFGIPYIVTIRNTDVNVFFKYMIHLRNIGREIMENAQSIIFLSPIYRDLVLKKYSTKCNYKKIFEKSFVIPNGIDQYYIDNKLTTAKKMVSDHIRLIYVGSINYNKNIRTTIKVCKFLQQSGYPIKYTIVGKILKKKYIKIFSRYDFIDYHLNCSKYEVLGLLRNSDIFIMPSIHESFGLVYAEAMSQGLPIIYTRGQGFDGQFGDGVVGFAVNPFDYKEISVRILNLWNAYEQFSSRCIRLVERFDLSTVAHEMYCLYEHSNS
jgi:glycosyltransferase involved in cell wall biosynthesis